LEPDLTSAKDYKEELRRELPYLLPTAIAGCAVLLVGGIVLFCVWAIARTLFEAGVGGGQ